MADMGRQKKTGKVITGTVDVPTKKKVRDSIIAKDGKTVKEYAIFDVLIPSGKRLFYDFFNKILSMILFGDGRGSGSAPGTFGYDYSRQYQKVSFGGYSSLDGSRPAVSPSSRPASYSGFEYDSFVFGSRGDVEAVLNQMTDILERYQMVTVADLYDCLGKDAPYTAENYGWRSMAGAKVGINGEGFTMILPPPKPLK